MFKYDNSRGNCTLDLLSKSSPLGHVDTSNIITVRKGCEIGNLDVLEYTGDETFAKYLSPNNRGLLTKTRTTLQLASPNLQKVAKIHTQKYYDPFRHMEIKQKHSL